MRKRKLIELVEAYCRETDSENAAARGYQIYCIIEPDLRLFIMGKVPPSGREDVMQETLIAIFKNLLKFKGNTESEFWGWCYRIALHKAIDSRLKYKRRTEHELPMDEISELVDASAEGKPLSAQDRLDLEYAKNLLSKSKPECLDFLWKHYVIGLDYGEIAEESDLKYDAVRMKVVRCLDTAQGLISD